MHYALGFLLLFRSTAILRTPEWVFLGLVDTVSRIPWNYYCLQMFTALVLWD